ncbi:hypothetical protein CQW23_28491 [Capsicum baccatum]|uniref:Uncharacterized protein n=1 Tax=Capsicum baccatum TaxID=33114 RepID=A0A2G2VGP5_CAPBA|nr:hypothetical protein CQW23_28491 [Capsicum baccatum]
MELEMTLEDFLTKASVVTEDDIRVPVIAITPPPLSSMKMVAPSTGGGFVVDNMIHIRNCQFSVAMQ